MTTPTAGKRKEAICADWLTSLSADEIRARISRRPGHTGKDGFYRHELQWLEEHRLETLQERHVVVERHVVAAVTEPKEEAPPNGADTGETERHGATDAADVHSPVRCFGTEDVPRPEPLVSEVPEFGMEAPSVEFRYPVMRERIHPVVDPPPAPAPDPLAELRAIAADLAARSATPAGVPAAEFARLKTHLMRMGLNLEDVGWTIHGPRGEWRRLG